MKLEEPMFGRKFSSAISMVELTTAAGIEGL
jgi:hypothetical protein